MTPFCGATDTPVLVFWWRLLWVSKPEWVLPYLHLAEVYMLHIPLRFTSGATPANLLAASRAAELTSFMFTSVLFVELVLVHSGFQGQTAQPYLYLAEACVMYVRWDSPLGDTCRPIISQHGGQGIGGARNRDLFSSIFSLSRSLSLDVSGQLIWPPISGYYLFPPKIGVFINVPILFNFFFVVFKISQCKHEEH